jgi:4,5-DOPA dioxygenase extradiol
MTTPLPALFLSHGSPLLALQDSPAGRFLDGLGARLPRPRAIVVASAHYTAPHVSIGGAALPATVHDFGGFPAELHRIGYAAPGDPALAERLAGLLWDARISAAVEPARGLDHGVWVPLSRMYPDAEIPVVPLSVDPRGDARSHLAVGNALRPLRDEGVLLIGSGGFVHNLGALEWSDPEAAVPDWAAEFSDWMHSRLAGGELESIADWQARAPHARRAHPTIEHLLPLFVALGAAGPDPRVRVLHRSHEHGSLALDAFAFE